MAQFVAFTEADRRRKRAGKPRPVRITESANTGKPHVYRYPSGCRAWNPAAYAIEAKRAREEKAARRRAKDAGKLEHLMKLAEGLPGVMPKKLTDAIRAQLRRMEG